MAEYPYGPGAKPDLATYPDSQSSFISRVSEVVEKCLKEEAGIRQRQYADVMRIISQQDESFDRRINALSRLHDEAQCDMKAAVERIDALKEENLAFRQLKLAQDERIDVQESHVNGYGRRIRRLERSEFNLRDDEDFSEVSAADHTWPERVDKEVPVKKRFIPHTIQLEVWDVREKLPEPVRPNRKAQVLFWLKSTHLCFGEYNAVLHEWTTATNGYITSQIAYWAYAPRIEG